MTIPTAPTASLAFTPAMPSPPPFDRYAWERAVVASGLHRNARLVAFVLAHHADPAGYLPAGGIQSAGKLAHLARITPRQARLSLQQLTNWHYIGRPDIRDWPQSAPVRPVLLTVPPRPAPEDPDAEALS